jgi:hypothetical protein
MVESAKKWKIVSDGTSHGIKIISPSGELVGMVQKLTIVIECGEPCVKADMSVILPQLDIEVPESSFSDFVVQGERQDFMKGNFGEKGTGDGEDR